MSDSEDLDQIQHDRLEDNEVDPASHKKLLQAIGRLGKNQHIRKPSRSEPSLARDEFHLVKPLSAQVQTVSMGDVMKLLKKTSKHVEIGKELQKVRNAKKVLMKPLEKPVAERIHRTVGYEKAQKSLSRWDAVVERNRVAEHQVFPLDYEEIHVELAAPKKPKGMTIKSDLMLEMEAVEEKLRELKGLNPSSDKNDDEFKQIEKLTRDELIARRKELAYLRIRESQKSAKARLQNKIKSKKYHKFLKREKLKEQLKEFELLQKTNPEAALEKLESIEKNRVMERASLRHKNTGTWAKNLQVRAKYDKDVRKDLAEQLAMSRELTGKKRNEDDSHSEEDDAGKDEEDSYDPFNPWVKGNKKVEQSDEMKEYLTGYRKYWMERNKNEKELEEYRQTIAGEKETAAKGIQNADEQSNEEDPEKDIEEFKSVSDARSRKQSKKSFPAKLTNGSAIQKHSQPDKNSKKPKAQKSRPNLAEIQRVKDSGNCEWTVEDLSDLTNQDVDDIFDNAEELLQQKFQDKFSKLSRDLARKKLEKTTGQKAKKRKSNSQDLSFKTQARRPDIDEELLETPAHEEPSLQLTENSRLIGSDPITKSNENSIDPNQFSKIKPKYLKTALPDMVNSGELSDDDDVAENQSRNLTIVEAFEDDDIVADFERDKEQERKKTAGEDVDLTLPGWGSWAGCGISKDRQTKRLILKFAKDAPRKDANKGNVFINEETNAKLKNHLVSDLPFPFKSVHEYEGSIRAPIGRTFVPETAFRMLTRPAAVTKLGAIIEPMDEEFLIKSPKGPRCVVDTRIEEMKTNKKR